MRKIAMIALPITIFLAGLLIGAFALVDLKPAEASVPAQVERGAGWAVENFRSITFEERQWTQLGQTGSCVIYRSAPGVNDPATITVSTAIEDFEIDYPNSGARVIVCAGFTAFFPPVSFGIAPTEE